MSKLFQWTACPPGRWEGPTPTGCLANTSHSGCQTHRQPRQVGGRPLLFQHIAKTERPQRLAPCLDYMEVPQGLSCRPTQALKD